MDWFVVFIIIVSGFGGCALVSVFMFIVVSMLLGVDDRTESCFFRAWERVLWPWGGWKNFFFAWLIVFRLGWLIEEYVREVENMLLNKGGER